MKKLVIALLSAAALVGLYFLLSALFPLESRGKLDTPDGLTIKKFTLQWNYNSSADEYGILVEGETEERISQTNRIFLRYDDREKTVRVRAISKNNRMQTSDYSPPLEAIFSDNIKEIVTYKIPALHYERTEFIYNGVVKAYTPDLTDRGYNFCYWYKISGGETIPVLDNISAQDTVVLYAKLLPITYKLNIDCGNFPLPANAKTEYTVEDYFDIFNMNSRSKGYEIKGWYADKERRIPLDKNTPCIGDLTIYPLISLINEGLNFDATGSLTGFTGNESQAFIPDEYNGMKVTSVQGKAFWVKQAADGQVIVNNLSSIIFYSESITLKKNAIGCSEKLNKIVFEGNAFLKKGAIKIPDEQTNEIEIIFKGNIALEDDFISGLLGDYKANVTVYVLPEKILSVPRGKYNVKAYTAEA